MESKKSVRIREDKHLESINNQLKLGDTALTEDEAFEHFLKVAQEIQQIELKHQSETEFTKKLKYNLVAHLSIYTARRIEKLKSQFKDQRDQLSKEFERNQDLEEQEEQVEESQDLEEEDEQDEENQDGGEEKEQVIEFAINFLARLKNIKNYINTFSSNPTAIVRIAEFLFSKYEYGDPDEIDEILEIWSKNLLPFMVEVIYHLKELRMSLHFKYYEYIVQATIEILDKLNSARRGKIEEIIDEKSGLSKRDFKELINITDDIVKDFNVIFEVKDAIRVGTCAIDLVSVLSELRLLSVQMQYMDIAESISKKLIKNFEKVGKILKSDTLEIIENMVDESDIEVISYFNKYVEKMHQSTERLKNLAELIMILKCIIEQFIYRDYLNKEVAVTIIKAALNLCQYLEQSNMLDNAKSFYDQALTIYLTQLRGGEFSQLTNEGINLRLAIEQLHITLYGNYNIPTTTITPLKAELKRELSIAIQQYMELGKAANINLEIQRVLTVKGVIYFLVRKSPEESLSELAVFLKNYFEQNLKQDSIIFDNSAIIINGYNEYFIGKLLEQVKKDLKPKKQSQPTVVRSNFKKVEKVEKTYFDFSIEPLKYISNTKKISNSERKLIKFYNFLEDLRVREYTNNILKKIKIKKEELGRSDRLDKKLKSQKAVLTSIEKESLEKPAVSSQFKDPNNNSTSIILQKLDDRHESSPSFLLKNSVKAPNYLLNPTLIDERIKRLQLIAIDSLNVVRVLFNEYSLSAGHGDISCLSYRNRFMRYIRQFFIAMMCLEKYLSVKFLKFGDGKWQEYRHKIVHSRVKLDDLLELAKLLLNYFYDKKDHLLTDNAHIKLEISKLMLLKFNNNFIDVNDCEESIYIHIKRISLYKETIIKMLAEPGFLIEIYKLWVSGFINDDSKIICINKGLIDFCAVIESVAEIGEAFARLREFPQASSSKLWQIPDLLDFVTVAKNAVRNKLYHILSEVVDVGSIEGLFSINEITDVLSLAINSVDILKLAEVQKIDSCSNSMETKELSLNYSKI